MNSKKFVNVVKGNLTFEVRDTIIELKVGNLMTVCLCT